MGHKCNYGINYDYTATPLHGTNERAISYRSITRWRGEDSATFPNFSSNRAPRGRVDPCVLTRRSFERGKKKKEKEGGKNDSPCTSERSGSIFVRAKDKASERTKGRRTRILIKNNSHAGRFLPGPTHPPLPPAFRQLRERPSDPTAVDPIGNKDDPCTAPDAFAIFRNHRVSRYAY